MTETRNAINPPPKKEKKMGGSAYCSDVADRKKLSPAALFKVTTLFESSMERDENDDNKQAKLSLAECIR